MLAYSHKADYRRAIADYDQAIKLRPDYADAFDNRGTAYRRLGRFERAIADYDQAIKLLPDYSFTYERRCWTRAISGGALDLALADCNESLRLRANDAEVLESRCFVRFKLGDYGRAIEDCSAALNGNAKLAISLQIRGLAKLRLADPTGGARPTSPPRKCSTAMWQSSSPVTACACRAGGASLGG